MGKQGKPKDWGKAANTAMVDLTVIALMAKTEYAAYQVLEEPEAANAALGQFKQFILENKLEDASTLRLLNSYSKGNRDDIVRGFVQISGAVAGLQIEGAVENAGLLEDGALDTLMESAPDSDGSWIKEASEEQDESQE